MKVNCFTQVKLILWRRKQGRNRIEKMKTLLLSTLTFLSLSAYGAPTLKELQELNSIALLVRVMTDEATPMCDISMDDLPMFSGAVQAAVDEKKEAFLKTASAKTLPSAEELALCADACLCSLYVDLFATAKVNKKVEPLKTALAKAEKKASSMTNDQASACLKKTDQLCASPLLKSIKESIQ